MVKKTEEIFGRRYDVEIFRRHEVKSSGVSLIMPCYNGLELTRMAVKCIRKFTITPYSLWIVDNASDEKTVAWLKEQEDVNLILNRTGTHNLQEDGKNWWQINYGGSVANAVGLELGARYVDTDWTFVMHNDALPVKAGWLKMMLSKMSDSTRGVATRRDPTRVHAMHQSGMLFDRNLYVELNMSFLPKMPQYDVGDYITLALESGGYECFYFQNSFNDPQLLEQSPLREHWLNQLYCDKAVTEDGEPFYLHLGRGTLQATGPESAKRKTTVQDWCQLLNKELFGIEESSPGWWQRMKQMVGSKKSE